MAEEEYNEEVGGDEEDAELEGVDGDLGNSGEIEGAQAELEAMKARLAEMEKEATKLRDVQGGQEGTAGPSSDVNREESDARSVYVGQVDYATTPEELQMHFQSCGTVNRVTILSDKFGNPKGYAYIEFLEPDAVQNALLLNDSELRGRQIKVLPKRTNVPGMKAYTSGGRGRGRGGRGGRGFGRFNPYYSGGYGYVPRGRGRGRGRFYSPY